MPYAPSLSSRQLEFSSNSTVWYLYGVSQPYTPTPPLHLPCLAYTCIFQCKRCIFVIVLGVFICRKSTAEKWLEIFKVELRLKQWSYQRFRRRMRSFSIPLCTSCTPFLVLFHIYALASYSVIGLDNLLPLLLYADQILKRKCNPTWLICSHLSCESLLPVNLGK